MPTAEHEPSFPMPLDFPLSAEARAGARITGVAAEDIDDEWRMFRAHAVKRGDVSTARGWYASFADGWCVQAKRIAADRRERRLRPALVRGAPPPPEAPAFGVVYTPGPPDPTPEELDRIPFVNPWARVPGGRPPSGDAAPRGEAFGPRSALG